MSLPESNTHSEVCKGLRRTLVTSGLVTSGSACWRGQALHLLQQGTMNECRFLHASPSRVAGASEARGLHPKPLRPTTTSSLLLVTFLIEFPEAVMLTEKHMDYVSIHLAFYRPQFAFFSRVVAVLGICVLTTLAASFGSSGSRS